MALAQRVKVLVLFPAIVLTVFLAIAAILRTELVWMLGLTALMTVVGLQMGYLAGTGIRHLTVLARASRRPTGPLTSSTPPHRPAH